MTQLQNIAVLGAGVMGLSAAHALLENGHKITLCDPKGFLADNASAMAGGMLAPYSEIEHMPPEWIEAGLAGIELWERGGFEITRNGSLFIAHDEDRYILERFKTHLPDEAGQAVRTRDIEPQLDGRFPSALYLPSEAHLDPKAALAALHKRIKDRGAECITGTLQNEFDLAIDCRGWGAAEDDKDLRPVKGEILLVRNPEFNLSRPVRLMHPRYPLYIVPRDDHVFMIGATVIESGDEQVSLRSGLELMSALYSLHPSFGEAELLEIKAGIRPAYPDNLPRITIDDNIIRCNGLFRHGYLLAPVMAECVKDFIAGNKNKWMDLLYESHHQRKRKELRSAA